jgi:hypothetical protein
VDQILGGEQVDRALPVCRHEVLDIECRLAEQNLAAFLLERQQLPLNGAHRGLADIAVAAG